MMTEKAADPPQKLKAHLQERIIKTGGLYYIAA